MRAYACVYIYSNSKCDIIIASTYNLPILPPHTSTISHVVPSNPLLQSQESILLALLASPLGDLLLILLPLLFDVEDVVVVDGLDS